MKNLSSIKAVAINELIPIKNTLELREVLFYEY